MSTSTAASPARSGFTERDVASEPAGLALGERRRSRRPTGSTRRRACNTPSSCRRRSTGSTRSRRCAPRRSRCRDSQRPQLLGNLATIERDVSRRRDHPLQRAAGARRARGQRAAPTSVGRRRGRATSSSRSARACRAARASPSAARPRACARASRRSPAGLVLAIAARLPADGRELPVVARPVHHPDGAAGRARRHPVDAVPHADDISMPALMGAIMCVGVATATGSWSSRSRTSTREEKKLDAHGGRARRRDDAAPARADDGAGDDHRHAARWRSGSARAASRTRRSAAP